MAQRCNINMRLLGGPGILSNYLRLHVDAPVDRRTITNHFPGPLDFFPNAWYLQITRVSENNSK